jgi:hypothetical protein
MTTFFAFSKNEILFLAILRDLYLGNKNNHFFKKVEYELVSKKSKANQSKRHVLQISTTNPKQVIISLLVILLKLPNSSLITSPDNHHMNNSIMHDINHHYNK